MRLEPFSRRSFLALTGMAVAQTALRPAFGQSQDFAYSTRKEASELVHRKTVVVVDDHPIFRDGLRRLLEREPDLKVVGDAHNTVEAMKLVRQLKPDILTTDMCRPNDSGFETLRELNATPVRAIVLTAAVDNRRIVTAFQLGARGVVLKGSATQVLLKAIHTVMAGEYWVLREPVSNLKPYLRTLMERIRHEGEARWLTARELEIVSAVVAGYSNKEIAEYFKISKDTVKRHLTNIYDKVCESTRLNLALFALNQELPLKSID